MAKEPLGSGTLEKRVEQASGKALFAEAVTMSKVETFALNVDDFARMVNGESTIVAEVAIGPLVVIATKEMDASASLGGST